MSKLIDLSNRYDTDKKPDFHNYVPIYEEWFSKIKVENLLEIGLGSGASVKMWIDYLPNSNIHCLEYFSEEFNNTWRDKADTNIEKLNLIIGDSTESPTWETIPFDLDVIIDDGNHHPNAQIGTFKNGFSHLRSGGLYFIEDTHANFMKIYNDGDDIIYDWVFDLVFNQQLASSSPIGDFYKAQEYMKGIEKNIYSYHFYKSLILFVKA